MDNTNLGRLVCLFRAKRSKSFFLISLACKKLGRREVDSVSSVGEIMKEITTLRLQAAASIVLSKNSHLG